MNPDMTNDTYNGYGPQRLHHPLLPRPPIPMYPTSAQHLVPPAPFTFRAYPPDARQYGALPTSQHRQFDPRPHVPTPPLAFGAAATDPFWSGNQPFTPWPAMPMPRAVPLPTQSSTPVAGGSRRISPDYVQSHHSPASSLPPVFTAQSWPPVAMPRGVASQATSPSTSVAVGPPVPVGRPVVDPRSGQRPAKRRRVQPQPSVPDGTALSTPSGPAPASPQYGTTKPADDVSAHMQVIRDAHPFPCGIGRCTTIITATMEGVKEHLNTVHCARNGTHILDNPDPRFCPWPECRIHLKDPETRPDEQTRLRHILERHGSFATYRCLVCRREVSWANRSMRRHVADCLKKLTGKKPVPRPRARQPGSPSLRFRNASFAVPTAGCIDDDAILTAHHRVENTASGHGGSPSSSPHAAADQLPDENSQDHIVGSANAVNPARSTQCCWVFVEFGPDGTRREHAALPDDASSEPEDPENESQAGYEHTFNARSTSPAGFPGAEDDNTILPVPLGSPASNGAAAPAVFDEQFDPFADIDDAEFRVALEAYSFQLEQNAANTILERCGEGNVVSQDKPSCSSDINVANAAVASEPAPTEPPAPSKANKENVAPSDVPWDSESIDAPDPIAHFLDDLLAFDAPLAVDSSWWDGSEGSELSFDDFLLGMGLPQPPATDVTEAPSSGPSTVPVIVF
ncbi:uncharacterized protein B0H18DRAFT_955016 [Fomitopsis serialis]|uniref:uncharacterized protein n=1 Tax=Fomitopsis serialis TaxID=139415 RepID=UPI002007DFE7|nr:uncharacterized protein B0H18DRAFT_955016 [Neoantrodia serialis]KAH9925835.1 hypothetical protein B0H18DRAFT_955016 [Neoantrodia serialis]